MRTIIKDAVWRILELFYQNRNALLHLREISRQINLRESATSRHLDNLSKNNILKIIKEGNMKKFYVNRQKIADIFPFFDSEKLNSLPLLRRNAIKEYLKKLDKKPVSILVFGSTARGNFKQDSDIDLLEIVNEKTDTKEAISYAESQTGVHIQQFQIKERDFKAEIKLKNDHVIQSAINTGFPIFNSRYYYEMIYSE